jgi:predicted nucleotidyltransferase
LVAKKKTKVKKKSVLETDYDIAYDFSMKAYKQFKEVIKSIVLFGSVAEGKVKKGSDIDLVIIIDDCTIDWDQELIAWYREELGKLVSEQGYKKELHINTVTLSAFWEEVKIGDPIAINVIRYGQPLVDFGGYFAPLKILLAKGKIRPTPEAVYTTLRRSPLHISRAKFNIVSSIENLYWAMVDSAHAALMAAGQVPPSPEHVGDLLNVIFVSKKRLNKKYISWFEEMHVLAHDVIHGNVKHLKGEIIDKYMDRTIEFEKVMRAITSNLLEREKIIRTKRD